MDHKNVNGIPYSKNGNDYVLLNHVNNSKKDPTGAIARSMPINIINPSPKKYSKGLYNLSPFTSSISQKSYSSQAKSSDILIGSFSPDKTSSNQIANSSPVKTSSYQTDITNPDRTSADTNDSTSPVEKCTGPLANPNYIPQGQCVTIDEHKSQSHKPSDLYYWGNLSRSEAENKLRGLPDGSFLVRNSSIEGAYTLTFRHQGQCKSLRIWCQDNLYGIKKDKCTFDSLTELVYNYGVFSLKSFNPSLDVFLLHPVIKKKGFRSAVSKYEALKLVWKLSKRRQEERKKHDDLVLRHNELVQKKSLLTLELKAQKVGQEMFETITSRADQLLEELDEIEAADENKRKMLQENTALVLLKHAAIVERIKVLEEEIQQRDKEISNSARELNQQLAAMTETHEDCEYIQDELIECGLQPDLVYCIVDELEGYTFPTEQWLVDCNREESHALLMDKDSGTFLIRPKYDNPEKPYVLSIRSCDLDGSQDVKHCFICHPEGRGYGFRDDAAVFESLEELVEKHTQAPLKIYFANLQTCLAFPVFGSQAQEVAEFEGDMEELPDSPEAD
ncbi:phosphatidylinositol 3-kinase regulatory subunit gamma [Biomphalaria glabrata]|nr:phosphatidylinositol 3-kinase regulatory subunit gamma-like [Biomphalaria glabrata]